MATGSHLFPVGKLSAIRSLQFLYVSGRFRIQLSKLQPKGAGSRARRRTLILTVSLTLVTSLASLVTSLGVRHTLLHPRRVLLLRRWRQALLVVLHLLWRHLLRLHLLLHLMRLHLLLPMRPLLLLVLLWLLQVRWRLMLLATWGRSGVSRKCPRLRAALRLHALLLHYSLPVTRTLVLFRLHACRALPLPAIARLPWL